MLRGHIDLVTTRRVAGWAYDSGRDGPVELVIARGAEILARIVADAYRPDLAAAGFGSGRHGFDLRLPVPLPGDEPHTITVRGEADGTDLCGSPATLRPMSPVDRAALDGLDPDADDAQLRATATALAGQTGAVLRMLADRRSGRLEQARHAAWQARWRSLPGSAPLPPEPGPRALMLDETLPAAGRNAGSNAVLSHAAALQRLGFAVTVAGADMAGGPAVAALEALGLGVGAAPWQACIEDLLRQEAGTFGLVYLHRAGIARDYLGLVRRTMPRARVVYSVADLHHVRLQRQAEAEGRPELRALARQLRAQELSAAFGADEVITHSPVEAALLRQAVPDARITVVPWAVPLAPTARPFAARSGIAFIGDGRHEPNRDAALWLIDEIMPVVRQADPAIECLLVGSDLPAAVMRPRPGITVLGAVPDLRTVFDRVRLTVAPLAYGAGIKGKVLDSLAAGVPCVCTPVAAEGIALPDPLRGLVATDTEGLARAILQCHRDAALNQAAGKAGLALIAQAWSASRVDSTLGQVAGISAFERAAGWSDPPRTAAVAAASQEGPA